MDSRVKRITQLVKGFDSRLYAHRAGSGVVQIHRQADKWEAADLCQEVPDLARLRPQFILALTNDWSPFGNPVEWGLEPITRKLLEMDGWRDDRQFNEMRERRNSAQRDRERQNRNELRARAADMRRDFAKATNDINTSTLAKIDRRREYNGNSK